MPSIVSAFTIITSPSAEVLMLKRRDSTFTSNKQKLYVSGTYELPGGIIDEKEDPLHAALREAFEETASLLRSTNYKKIGTFENNKGNVLFYHYPAEKDEYEEIFSHTHRLTQNLALNHIPRRLLPSEISEHTGVRSMKVWEVYALAKEKRVVFHEDGPINGLTLQRMLVLPADIVTLTLLENYGDTIMSELSRREKDIIVELSKELVGPIKSELKENIAELKTFGRDSARFRGIDGDLKRTDKNGTRFRY